MWPQIYQHTNWFQPRIFALLEMGIKSPFPEDIFSNFYLLLALEITMKADVRLAV